MAGTRPRFKIRFPMIQLRPEYGGKHVLVLFSAKPAGDTSGIVLATCIDFEGKPMANIPVQLSEVHAASMKPITLVEVDGEDNAPVGGLYDLTGKSVR